MPTKKKPHGNHHKKFDPETATADQLNQAAKKIWERNPLMLGDCNDALGYFIRAIEKKEHDEIAIEPEEYYDLAIKIEDSKKKYSIMMEKDAIKYFKKAIETKENRRLPIDPEEYFQIAIKLEEVATQFDDEKLDEAVDEMLFYHAKAAEMNHDNACNSMGILLHHYKKNLSAAIIFYEKGAELGNVLAKANLGAILLGSFDEEFGVELKNHQRAIPILKEAAHSGSSGAAENLASCYRLGIGVDVSEEKMQYYNDLAKENNKLNQISRITSVVNLVALNNEKSGKISVKF